MLERLHDLPPGIDGIRAKGKITSGDYERVVKPLLEEARAAGRRVRLLYELGPEFEGFTAAAAWEDMRLGFRHLRLLERCGIVTDVGWVRESARLFGAMVPAPVRVFGNAERAAALEWLGAPAGGAAPRTRLIPGTGVVVFEPEHALSAEDFDALALVVDPWIEANGELRGLVLHARDFPGWENVGAFFRHLRFVRDHHKFIRRIAICVGGTFASVGPRIAEHFVAAELKHFRADQLDAAIAWAGAG
jgi:hypothetical protein